MRATLILLICIAYSPKLISQHNAPTPLVKIVVEAMLENPRIRAARYVSAETSGVFFRHNEYEIEGNAHGVAYKIWPDKNLFMYVIKYYFNFTRMEITDDKINAEYQTITEYNYPKGKDINGVIVLEKDGDNWIVTKHKINGP
ncbi:MAG: hypothetical protein JKY52_07050 [Flavobacteriales bacterium]|nr:hypothetical protein [Flavobacteriales bacterium]